MYEGDLCRAQYRKVEEPDDEDAVTGALSVPFLHSRCILLDDKSAAG